MAYISLVASQSGKLERGWNFPDRMGARLTLHIVKPL